MIRFACSHCGRHISVDDKHSGKQGKCPKCESVVVVPERSTIIEFRCQSCGHKIKVPEGYGGKKGKCPKCKNAVVVPSLPQEPVEEGSVAPEYDASTAPDIDEDLYEASPEVPAASVGVDRRLIVLIGGVAAVVLVGCVILVVTLRSSGSGPAEDREARHGQRELTPTASRAEPVISDTLPTERTSPTAAAETIRLRFRPAPGPAQTMEVTTRLTVSSAEDGQQQGMTTTEACTFDLEVDEASADGTIPIRIALAAIRIKSEAQGKTMGEYDSTQPSADDNAMADFYTPFIGKGFTIKVSPRGRILDFGLDELFLAVAENPLLYRAKIRGLLGNLVASLPEQPMRRGDSWSDPVVIELGTPVEMAATHTLEAVDDDSCTIAARGQRALDEEPFVQEIGQTRVRNKLGGSSEVMVTVDRTTGRLLNKEQTTHLSGQIETSTPGSQRPDTTMEVSVEVTTTVKSVQ